MLMPPYESMLQTHLVTWSSHKTFFLQKRGIQRRAMRLTEGMELLHKKKDQHDKNCENIEYLCCNFKKKSINIIIITLAELHRRAYYCCYHWMEFMKVTLWLYIYKPGWNFTASCLTALKDLCSFLFRLQTGSFRFTYCWQAFDNTAHLFFVAHLSCSFLLHIRTLLCWWMQAGPLISGHFLKQSVRNGIAVN